MLPLLDYSINHLQKLAEIEDGTLSIKLKHDKDVVIGRNHSLNYLFTGARGNRIRDLFILGKLSVKSGVSNGNYLQIFARNVFIAGELNLENMELKHKQIIRFKNAHSFSKAVKLALGWKRWLRLKATKSSLFVDSSISWELLRHKASIIPDVISEELELRKGLYDNQLIQLTAPRRKVKDHEQAIYEALSRCRIREAVEKYKLNQLIDEFKDQISLPRLIQENPVEKVIETAERVETVPPPILRRSPVMLVRTIVTIVLLMTIGKLSGLLRGILNNTKMS